MLIIIILFMSSCVSSPTIGGFENLGTTITGQDFKYIAKVQGEATSNRLFFLFRLGSGDIYNRAMADITNKANLYDGSKKGLINLTYDYRIELSWLIFGKEVVTVTADVIEYID